MPDRISDRIYFGSPAEFREWLQEPTGRPSLTWSESVDEALCFGWIDGIRKSVGAEAYVIRFTPRRPPVGVDASRTRT